MKLSIIIPTYNREEVLCDTIESVLKEISNSSCAKESEIFIIDQTLKHKEAVSQYLNSLSSYSIIKYMYVPIANLPNARNVGISSASGEIICFLDDDIKLHVGFFNQLMKRYEDENNMSVVGLPILKNSSGCNILLQSGNPLKQFIKRSLLKILGHGKSSHISRLGFNLSNRSDAKAGFADTGMGCCMSFRKTVFETVGLFDVNYIGNALREETDMFCRMKKNGLYVFFDPQIILDHIMSNSGGCRSEKSEEYWKNYFYNNYYFFRKNFNFPQWYINCLLFFDIRALKKTKYVFKEILEESWAKTTNVLFNSSR